MPTQLRNTNKFEALKSAEMCGVSLPSCWSSLSVFVWITHKQPLMAHYLVQSNAGHFWGIDLRPSKNTWCYMVQHFEKNHAERLENGTVPAVAPRMNEENHITPIASHPVLLWMRKGTNLKTSQKTSNPSLSQGHIMPCHQRTWPTRLGDVLPKPASANRSFAPFARPSCSWNLMSALKRRNVQLLSCLGFSTSYL